MSTPTPPRAPSTSSSKSSSKAGPIAIVAGVAVVAALLGVVSFTATKPSSPGASGASAAEASVDADTSGMKSNARRDPADPLALGRADAPVVLVEYADFQCGYCGQFARETEPALVEKYVGNGTLRIEWRNFPIFGEESEAIARASWAAGQQGRFREFHRAVFAPGAKEKGFGKDRLAALAKEAGVPDAARFAKDSEGPAARAAVRRDQAEGHEAGVTSTPSFLLNGFAIGGAQPLDSFTEAIDALARSAKESAASAGTGR